MNLTDIILRTRDILGEHQTVSQEWSDSELLRHINAGLEETWKKGVQADESWGIETCYLSDLTVTYTQFGANKIKVTFTDPPLGRIKRIEEEQTNYPPIEIPYCDVGNSDGFDRLFPTFAYEKRQWMFGANDKTLYFLVTGVAFDPTKIRLWYYRKHPQLCRFTVASADVNSTTTLKTSILTGISTDSNGGAMGKLSSLKGYYKNCYLECVSGNSLSPQSLQFQVTDYSVAAYPKYQFTVDPAHGLVAPAYATTWEVIPYWPEEQHELISAMGARNALLKGNDPEGKKGVDQYAGNHMALFIETMQQRQYQTSRRVKYEEGVE